MLKLHQCQGIKNNGWNEEEASALAVQTQLSPAGFALSMWKQNTYRRNEHLQEWHGTERTITHFYHVGATENLRNEMQEALIIRDGFAFNIEAPKI